MSFDSYDSSVNDNNPIDSVSSVLSYGSMISEESSSMTFCSRHLFPRIHQWTPVILMMIHPCPPRIQITLLFNYVLLQ
jgi:hypothetical protein